MCVRAVCNGLPYLQLNGLLHMFIYHIQLPIRIETCLYNVCSYSILLYTHTNSMPSGCYLRLQLKYWLIAVCTYIYVYKSNNQSNQLQQCAALGALMQDTVRYKNLYLPRKAARVCYKLEYFIIRDYIFRAHENCFIACSSVLGQTKYTSI